MHIKTLALAIVGALLISGCGGSGGNGTSTGDGVDTGSSGDGDGVTPDVNGGGGAGTEKVAAEIVFTRVEAWKGGATAAYSLMHDDFCQTPAGSEDGTVENWQLLEQRSLVAGFGAIASYCDKTYSYASSTSEFKGQTYFQIMTAMEQAGMEIVNHTFDHTMFFNTRTYEDQNGNEKTEVDKSNPLDSGVWQAQVNDAYTVLTGKGLTINYFAFPQDQSNDDMLTYLKGQSYIGARGGEHKINAADIINDSAGLAPFKADFDCFNFNQKDSHGYNCSRYSSDPLQQYLDATIADGGWGIRELHGIDTSSWGYVTPVQYKTHLDALQTLVTQDKLWVATPTTVTKYWAAKTYCGNPTVTNNTLSYDSYNEPNNCITYGQGSKLDIVISSTAANGVYAEQDNNNIEVVALGNSLYRLSLDPYGSTISVYESE